MNRRDFFRTAAAAAGAMVCDPVPAACLSGIDGWLPIANSDAAAFFGIDRVDPRQTAVLDEWAKTVRWVG